MVLGLLLGVMVTPERLMPWKLTAAAFSDMVMLLPTAFAVGVPLPSHSVYPVVTT